MKRMILSAALFLAATGTGCDKAEVPTTSESGRIAITTEIGAITKAPQLDEDGSGSFTPGDIFTLYAHDGVSGSQTTEYTVGGTVLYWRDLDFVSSGEKLRFAACYPKQELTDGGFDFTVTQDAGGDLLWALSSEVEAGTDRPVVLRFRHALHRLVVKFTQTDSSVDVATIETRCTGYVTGRFDLPTGDFTPEGPAGTFMGQGQEVEFLLLPQATSEVVLEVQAGDAAKSYRLSDLDPTYTKLEAGKRLTVELTIQNGKITVSGTEIEGWGDQGTIEGEIEI